MQETVHNAEIPEEMCGTRLDQVLAQLFPQHSRSRLQQWLKDGHILLNGKSHPAKYKVFGGEQVEVHEQHSPQLEDAPEAIPLDIVFEDDSILVLNKPAGLVVHPAAGNRSGTLLNALLHHAPDMANLPRAGIVHRLDKDTTGLMVVAKTLEAHTALVAQLQAREMGREYEAVVMGVMTGGGRVDEPLGRHPQDRKRMAVIDSGKPATTHYRVLQRYRNHTHIRLKLETGRTHQIRVHMAHIRYPLVGDPVYGGRLRIPPGCSVALDQTLRQFHRQALHAAQLTLEHPLSGETLSWQAPLPEDMQQLLSALAGDQKEHDNH